MNLEEIDKLCDLFEQRLKDGCEPDVDSFLREYQLPDEEQLVSELNRVARVYVDSFSAGLVEPPGSTATFTGMVQPGDTIGPYNLLQQIGEGGMGTVYMAEQETPVQRRVALKVIKPGMGSKEVVARFESERQALAMMDHENIAKMFDAGTTEDGRPYFVMELVRGVPLTKFCDDNKLSINERLELFTTVCQAVQHAHQKGIIHRDIKPSNVLVSNYDGRPVPKIIDFGVAKAMQQKLTNKTLFTEFGRVIGTLQYMSPEQAGLSHLDIDTRSDIYSLGVLLYELLTGSTPIDKQRIREVGWERIMQVIREEEPPKPSTKISDSGDVLAGISTQRHSNPGSLGSLVRGDLDWIVMKALEKDRSRRYETANGFAVDIQRHLNNEPVSAGPPSAGYRLRKFVKRNRVAVLAGSLVAAVFVVAVIGITGGFVWAFQERQIARERTEEAEARFDLAMQAVENYYKGVSVDIHLKQPQLEQLRDKLLRSAREFYQQLADELQGAKSARERENLARAITALARLTSIVGSKQEAVDGFSNALEIYLELAEEYPANAGYQKALAESYNRLSLTQLQNGDREGARESIQKSVRIFDQLVREYSSDSEHKSGLANAFNSLGQIQHAHGHLEAAQEAHQSSIPILKELAALQPSVASYKDRLAAGFLNLGMVQVASGDRNLARDSYQEAINISNQLVKEHPEVPEYRDGLAKCQNNFGNLHNRLGEPSKARNSFRNAVDNYKLLLKQFPNFNEYRIGLARAHFNIGNVQQGLGEMEEARDSYLASIHIFDELFEQNPREIDIMIGSCASRVGLGRLLRTTGLHDEPVNHFDLAIRRLENAFGLDPQHPSGKYYLLLAYQDRAQIRTQLNRHQDAANDWQRAVELDSGENKTQFRIYQAISLANIGNHIRAAKLADDLADGGVADVNAYNAACVYSLCVAAVIKDSALNADEQNQRTRQYGKRAVELLNQALDSGFFDDEDRIKNINQDEDLNAIRNRDDFKKLVKQIENTRAVKNDDL